MELNEVKAKDVVKVTKNGAEYFNLEFTRKITGAKQLEISSALHKKCNMMSCDISEAKDGTTFMTGRMIPGETFDLNECQKTLAALEFTSS